MENNVKRNHSLHITEDKITVTAVTNVVSFDEKQVVLNLSQGNLLLSGSNFEVEKVSVEEGTIELTGKITSLKYSNSHKKESIIKRIMK